MPSRNELVRLTVLKVDRKRGEIKVLANEWKIVFVSRRERLKKVFACREGVRGDDGFVPDYIFKAALRRAWAVLKKGS